jgi:hypothetical protein
MAGQNLAAAAQEGYLGNQWDRVLEEAQAQTGQSMLPSPLVSPGETAVPEDVLNFLQSGGGALPEAAAGIPAGVARRRNLLNLAGETLAEPSVL